MKIASTIARYLLGIMFTIFGLNGFLQFLPAPPMPPLAGQFFGALIASHYTVPIFLVQLTCGILFLVNRYVPLALTLIGPVIVNILIFHALMNPEGVAPGAVATVCWFILFKRLRPAFDGILRSQST